MRAVVVDWLDHAALDSAGAWSKVDDVDPTPPKVRSVGFVVKETETALVIAHSLGGGECCSPFVIVKSAIVFRAPVPLPKATKPAAKKAKAA